MKKGKGTESTFPSCLAGLDMAPLWEPAPDVAYKTQTHCNSSENAARRKHSPACQFHGVMLLFPDRWSDFCVSVWSQELELMILLGILQLGIFYNSSSQIAYVNHKESAFSSIVPGYYAFLSTGAECCTAVVLRLHSFSLRGKREIFLQFVTAL